MSEERENKNSVFTAGAPVGHDVRIPSMSQADAVKAEFGLDIPSELVPLPSNGKVYDTKSTLYNKETVEIRPMTAREEDILTSRALLKKGTVLTELIKSCVVDKGINPLDLVAGDRNALMIAIRVTGYGSDYSAEIECSSCEAKSKNIFDLSQLPIKRLSIDPVIEGQNVFEFLLPYTNKKVHFKFTTGRDEEELSALQDKQKKLGLKSDSAVTMALQQAIISIDGIHDRAKLANFIRNMPARDSLALRNYIKDNEPGVVMKQEVVCPECGHSEEVNMPLGVNFLWPSS